MTATPPPHNDWTAEDRDPALDRAGSPRLDRLREATAAGEAKSGLREGDQAKPVTADPAAPGAHDELLELVAERRAFGLGRYGTTLQPHNGRDTARDLTDELVDAAVYAITLRREVTDLEAVLLHLVEVWARTPGDDKVAALREGMTVARALLERRGVEL